MMMRMSLSLLTALLLAGAAVLSAQAQTGPIQGVAKGTALHQLRRTAMDAIAHTDSYMMLGQVARTCRSVADSRSTTTF